MRVVLAQPRGFCAGVERAIEIVERALEKYGPPIYVRHEIVHNRHVVERLRAKGAQFVDEIDEVPKGSVTIFSAQALPARSRSERPTAGFRSSSDMPAGLESSHRGPAVCQPGPRDHPDRTCRSSGDRRHNGADHRPGASDLHSRRKWRASMSPIPRSCLHHANHSQRRRYPRRDRSAEDAFSGDRRPRHQGHLLCDAKPPESGRELASVVDVVLVVGAPNSSNSNRLREIAAESGVGELSDRRCSRPRPGLDRGCRRGRHYRRRLGPRRAGGGGDCPAAGAGGKSSCRRCPGSPRTCAFECRRNSPTPAEARGGPKPPCDEDVPWEFRCAKQFV